MSLLIAALMALLGPQTPSPAPPSAPAAVSAPAPAPTPTPTPVPRTPDLPAAEEQAKDALNGSPRHGEWAEVKLEGSATPLRAWVVYPERKEKAGVVIVIHEIYGVSDWIRAVADQLAREGFIAVAPDLISGLGPNGGGTDSVASRDEVVKLVRSVSPEEANRRLDAVRRDAQALPAANQRTATLGFCWGGARSFGDAAHQPGLDAAVVYYGTSPEVADLARVRAPVLGHYGADDARVNATVPSAQTEMNRLGRVFEVHTYDGAGHGFLRNQSGRDGANYKATKAAWPRTIAFLRDRLK